MTASYDGSNQLASWNGITASSDSRGNLTYDPTNAASYTWNERNQLASAAAGTGSSSFGYDGLGRRVSRTSGGVTTQYLYDGLNVARELSTAGNAELLSGLGVDDWFGRTQSSATVAMLRDALGSTIGLVNAGGAIATSYGYEPFGATAASGVASFNSHRFTGREQDPTGLYYLRNRYYNPMLGRFLSPDPIGIAGGINLYAYTFDDPMNWVDPLGLSGGGGGGSGQGRPPSRAQLARDSSPDENGGPAPSAGVLPGANGDRPPASFNWASVKVLMTQGNINTGFSATIGQLCVGCSFAHGCEVAVIFGVSLGFGFDASVEAPGSHQEASIGFGAGRNLGLSVGFSGDSDTGEISIVSLGVHYGPGVGTPVYQSNSIEP